LSVVSCFVPTYLTTHAHNVKFGDSDERASPVAGQKVPKQGASLMSDAQNQQVYLAVDMGASSGRVVAGLFDGSKLQLKDVHRFENGPVTANDNMHWDLLRQWTNICDGLRAAGSEYGDAIKSVGVDTWGVDFGLLGRGDEFLGNPHHYRDARTVGMMDAAFAQVSRDEIFAETGLQFMELNTLYQLLAMKKSNSTILESAESFLMMPDLFHWLLTGEKANEFTDATTTQFYNPQTQGWSTTLFERFGLPTNILGEIAQPGTRLGTLRQSVCDATGLPSIDVVLPGTHDTASAVMAVPSSSQPSMSPDWCYISSGTWSLMGAEIPNPIINDTVSRFNSAETTTAGVRWWRCRPSRIRWSRSSIRTMPGSSLQKTCPLRYASIARRVDRLCPRMRARSFAVCYRAWHSGIDRYSTCSKK